MILFIVGSIVALCQIATVMFFIWQVSGAILIKIVGNLAFLSTTERLIITFPAQYFILEIVGNIFIIGFVS